MKTIEERAKEWGEHIFETTPYDVVDGKACVFVEDRDITDVAEESYIVGSTEQKLIDDSSLQERFQKVLTEQKWYLIDKACVILSDLGVFDWMADDAQEGFSPEVYKDQFVKCLTEE